MTLTNDDKKWIKDEVAGSIVDVLNEIVLPRFDAIESEVKETNDRLRSLESETALLREDLTSVDGRLEVIENDVRELHFMHAKRPNVQLAASNLAKLPLKDRLKVMHSAIQQIAQQEGVSLEA